MNPEDDSIARAPGALRFLSWALPLLVRKASARFYYSLRPECDERQWRVALRRRPPNESPAEAMGMDGFDWVPVPAGHFYADPFLAERDGQNWLFVEDYDASLERGAIAWTSVQASGSVGPFSVALSSPGHLSYPYVFEDDGEYYMIPESGDDGNVRLYRATAFPAEWTFDTEIYRGSARDTSLFRKDGRWWFFTTLTEPRGGESMLMLFTADSLRGSWVPHPANPISLDCRNVRGAGVIHHDGERLIRPSQDCSESYGYAFSLFEITTLTADAYEERLLRRVEPDWEPRLEATHTYNRTTHFETVDGRFNRHAIGATRRR